MATVTEIPLECVPGDELRIREWEAVMAGGYGCSEQRRIESERLRRCALRTGRAQERRSTPPR